MRDRIGVEVAPHDLGAGIEPVSARTIAAESWREAEASPRMLESMWRSFIGVRPWSKFVTWTRYVTVPMSQERIAVRPGHIEMTAPMHHPLHEDCSKVSQILARIGEKWSMLVVMLLRDGPRRFNDIKRNTVGISQQMLTRTLRGLERDGIVTRTIFPTSPPQVEYRLTDLGRSMSEPVLTFGEWIRGHLSEIDLARQRFDQRAENGLRAMANQDQFSA
jgi:DNA-binding HxlR family transcriptional regulator